MTIHKAQGMKLNAAVVHCRGAFRQYQISVAMGRVRSSANLEVLDFSKELCRISSNHVFAFQEQWSVQLLRTLPCCKNVPYVEQNIAQPNTEEETSVISDENIHEFTEADLDIIDEIE